MTDEDLIDVYVAQSNVGVTNARDFEAADSSVRHCFHLRRVQWRNSRPSPDGRQLICHFRAPDAESVRQTLRRAGIPFDRIWTE